LGVGRYWSDHWKSELLLGLSTWGRTTAELDGGDLHIMEWGTYFDASRYLHMSSRHRLVALTHQYQAFHNQWVHPALGLGIELDHASFRHRTFGCAPEAPELPSRTRTRVEPFAMAGGKLYVSQKTYLQAAIVHGFRGGHKPFSARLGVGRDW
jgi:hypothetical protein